MAAVIALCLRNTTAKNSSKLWCGQEKGRKVEQKIGMDSVNDSEDIRQGQIRGKESLGWGSIVRIVQ